MCRSFHLRALPGEPEELLMGTIISRSGKDRAAGKLPDATGVALCDTSGNRYGVRCAPNRRGVNAAFLLLKPVARLPIGPAPRMWTVAGTPLIVHLASVDESWRASGAIFQERLKFWVLVATRCTENSIEPNLLPQLNTEARNDRSRIRFWYVTELRFEQDCHIGR